MNVATIREKLISYVQVADEKKVKAIYVMVEDEINTANNDWDEDFIDELKLRSKQFSGNKAKTYTWEETKQAAIEAAKLRK